ncbi:MAG TPA: phosphoribosylformylglycinamidine synthase, partial [Spirochaetia bacterium]|nr:phosphoribosylformylglycinamidine synthase [Spirochaetia bacterium]
IMYSGKAVGLLDLEFLHRGLPVMELEARLEPASAASGDDAAAPAADTFPPLSELLTAVLADPNVCSRETLVRQYDHEVQGGSVVKPFVGAAADGPSDGAVVMPRYDSFRGITVTHGVCPRYGDADSYQMAANAVDEAFRAHVALGGDPDYAAALDNFCWPDPVASPSNPDGAHKLAQLVETARGLAAACLAYGLPLISGKDSMKNDAWSGTRKISIRPTLLVSLIGIIPDVRRAITTDFKTPGDLIYILGLTGDECAGSILERVTGKRFARVPAVDPERALPLYRVLHQAILKKLVRSCHDCAEGGLLTALAESAIGGRTGFFVDLDELPLREGEPPGLHSLLFSESASRLVVSVPPEHEKEFSSLFASQPHGFLGRVTADDNLVVSLSGKRVMALPLAQALAAWKGTLA